MLIPRHFMPAVFVPCFGQPSEERFFVLRRLVIGIVFGIILGLFGPTIAFDELFTSSFSCRCVCPFPWTSLNYLLTFAHSEVITVFSQSTSQTIYGDNQFCLHSRIVYLGLYVCATYARRSHFERDRYMIMSFSKDDAKIRSTFYFFQIFLQLFYIICDFF